MFDFSSQHAGRSRRGFTLVEMLVSVGLVVLMMSLFAFIFQVATGTMSRQRTISQNNQKVRLVATLLTNDLKKRTFRNLVPFMPHELEDHPTNFSDRRGYFYLSENSPYVETDTVLQFTVDSENADATAALSRGFVGRAQAHVGIGSGVINPTEHPDSDNGRLGDNLATARHAEISYFVRNGNLYRRLLLIRDERPTTEFEFVTGNQHVSENYNFSRFDFSMRENMATPGSAEFSVASDLDNLLDTKPPTNSVYASMKGLGLPQNRFGFWKPNAVQNPTNTRTGQSFEWLGSGGNALFIGRFTMQETSAAAFTFPNYDPGHGGPGHGHATNPLLQTLTDTNLDGAVDQFASGTRIGEDLLLSNVLSFTVEVWEGDHAGGRFVRLGHTGNSYLTNQTLDTWHRYSRVPTPTTTNPPTPFVASLPPTAPLLRYRPSELGTRVHHVGPFDGVKTVALNHVYLLWDGDTAGYPVGANDNRIQWNWNMTVLRCIQAGVPTAGRPDIREAAGEPADEIRHGSVIWSVESNVLAVRALQITIRFMHPSTDEPRQITIVQSLIDDEEFRTQ